MKLVVGVWNSINEDLSVSAGTPCCTPPSVAEWEVTTGTGATGAGDSVTGGSFLLRHQTRRRRLWRSWERGATHQQKFASFYRARDVLPPVGLGSSSRPERTRKWEWLEGSQGILTDTKHQTMWHSDKMISYTCRSLFNKMEKLSKYTSILYPW